MIDKSLLDNAVLQCYKCGREIRRGEDYSDVAITTAKCPEHEDYLDWEPQFEEYLCGSCAVLLANWFGISALPTI